MLNAFNEEKQSKIDLNENITNNFYCVLVALRSHKIFDASPSKTGEQLIPVFSVEGAPCKLKTAVR